MAEDNLLIMVLMQLLGQSPTLLVYIAGVILALLFWQRCPPACALTAAGMGLMLLVSVGATVFQTHLLHSRFGNNDWSAAEFGRIMTIITITGTTLRAFGLGLVLAAVFVGRNRRAQSVPVIPSEAGRFEPSRPDDPHIRA
jgi:hypothetical protein